MYVRTQSSNRPAPAWPDARVEQARTQHQRDNPAEPPIRLRAHDTLSKIEIERERKNEKEREIKRKIYIYIFVDKDR